MRASVGAQTDDVAGIGWDFWFDQYYMKQSASPYRTGRQFIAKVRTWLGFFEVASAWWRSGKHEVAYARCTVTF